MTKRTELIIFDCWGTLFFNSNRFLEVIAQKMGSSLRDYVFVKALENNLNLDTYEDLFIPFCKLVQEVTGEENPGLARECQTILMDSHAYQQAYPESIELLKRLRVDHKLALISNTSAQSFEFLLEKFPLYELFDLVLPSYKTHLIKPDPAIFHRALDELGVTAEGALMVGDSFKDDFEAARACGIHSVLVDRIERYPDVHDRITALEQVVQYIK